MKISERRKIGAANADAQVRLIRRLREIRINRGIQVADVADSMGVDPAMIYRFEKGGTNYTAATLRKYAKAVGALLHLDATDASLSMDPLGAQPVSVPDTIHDQIAAGNVNVTYTRETPKNQDKPSAQPASIDYYWAAGSLGIHVSLEGSRTSSSSTRSESTACR